MKDGPVKAGLVGILERPASAYALSPAARFVPVKRFVVFCSARSGSTLLMSLLGSHPKVRAAFELLSEPRPAPVRYLEGQAVEAWLRGRKRAFGFKVTFEQLRWSEHTFGPSDEVLRRLHEKGYTIVFLDRRSNLSQALSHMQIERLKAERGQDGAGHFQKDDDFEFRPYPVDAVEVLARLHHHESYAAWARTVLEGLPHLDLVYEDDLEPPERHQATADRIYEALGLESAPVESPLVRVTPPSPLDRVENIDELRAVLAPTRYASVLDE